jgi:hypothetical protein
MHNVHVLNRRPSPAKRPQPLTFFNNLLWMGSWETDRLYAIDPKTWQVVKEIPAPGRPYGLAAFGGKLRVVVALEDDNRYTFECSEDGFDLATKRACPDHTGSHLAVKGSTLYLCQLGNTRILELGDDGQPRRTIDLSTRFAGLGFAGNDAYIISADEEFEKLELAQIDISQDAPEVRPVAGFDIDVRALAFDGSSWWTSHREGDEIVTFSI